MFSLPCEPGFCSIRDIILPHNVHKAQVGFGRVCRHYEPISSSYMKEIVEKSYENLLPFWEIRPYQHFLQVPSPKKFFRREQVEGIQKNVLKKHFFSKNFTKPKNFNVRQHPLSWVQLDRSISTPKFAIKCIFLEKNHLKGDLKFILDLLKDVQNQIEAMVSKFTF